MDCEMRAMAIAPTCGLFSLTVIEGRHLLKAGLKSVARLFLLALGVDEIYQIVALRKFYPTEALATAALLAIVPYVLLRGPVNRSGQLLSRQKSMTHLVH